MSQQVMICKLQLHDVQPGGTLCASDNSPLPVSRVRFGAVWEGTTEKQQASENAVFGHWTPCAEFTASIMNQAVIDKMIVGKKYYVTFTEALD